MAQNKKEKFMDVYSNDNDIDSVNAFNSQCIISSKISSPFFSVLIPTYKRNEPLRQAIESFLNQNTDLNYEIVVVDDYPQSKVYENFIKDFRSDKISYYINEDNIGQCNNFNKSIQLSRGEYLVMLTDDDVVSPDFLSTVYKVILNLNYPAMIGVNYKTFTDSVSFAEAKPDIYYRNVTKRSFFFGRYINITGMTFKKSVADKIGGFKKKYDPIHDSVFIYNVVCNFNCVYIDNVLAGYRIGINLSLRDDVMEKIVLLMDECRKSIADHERFAERWMKLFGSEYFIQYVNGAALTWNKKMNIDELIKETGYDRNVSKVRYKIMKVVLRLEKILDRLVNRKIKLK